MEDLHVLSISAQMHHFSRHISYPIFPKCSHCIAWIERLIGAYTHLVGIFGACVFARRACPEVVCQHPWMNYCISQREHFRNPSVHKEQKVGTRITARRIDDKHGVLYRSTRSSDWKMSIQISLRKCPHYLPYMCLTPRSQSGNFSKQH